MYGSFNIIFSLFFLLVLKVLKLFNLVSVKLSSIAAVNVQRGFGLILNFILLFIS